MAETGDSSASESSSPTRIPRRPWRSEREGTQQPTRKRPNLDQNNNEDLGEPTHKVRVRNCPLIGCETMSRNLSRHVMDRHFPAALRSKNLKDPAQDNLRRELVMFLVYELRGEDSSIEDLVEWIKGQNPFHEKLAIPSGDAEWLTGIGKRHHWETPSQFTLRPINSLALIFHWRVVLVCLNHLSREKQIQFRKGKVSDLQEFEVVDSIGFTDESEEETAQAVQPADRNRPGPSQVQGHREDKPKETAQVDQSMDLNHPGPPLLEERQEDREVLDMAQVAQFTGQNNPGPSKALVAFDSHFHADRLSMSLFGHRQGGIHDLIEAEVGVTPGVRVQVQGGVTVYCDPENYPTRLHSTQGFGSAIGVHPKKCSLLTEGRFQTLLGFLASLDVVALGEIGIDWTDPEETWPLQQQTMVRLLEFSMPARPVILHMRERGDQHAGEVSALCLRLMKENVAPTQKIHLHSFGGTVEQVVGWLEAFPRCYFGFSARVSSFDKFQVAGLRRVPDSRLLLETDAPYFKPRGAMASTPAHLGDIGQVVANYRESTLKHVLDITTRNGQILYSL